MAHTMSGARPGRAPMFVTQQRKVREFLADQDPIAAIRADWLYQVNAYQPKDALLRAGFVPMRVPPLPRLDRGGSGPFFAA